MARIYLDHAATTMLSPQSRERMSEAFERFGNPSSPHAEGRAAREIADRCRVELVRRANATVAGGAYEFSDVVFTSGGTEAANLALAGLAMANEDPARRRIVLAAADHSCVLGTAPLLQRLGYAVDIARVDRSGRLAELPTGDDVLIVAAMAANNELGTVNDVEAIARAIAERGVLYAMDAVQAFGKTPIAARPDALWVSAHKIGGPKGIGALLLAPGVKIAPLVAGGEQERERRGGTENVLGLAGFLGALEDLDDLADAGKDARDGFWDALFAGGAIPTVYDRSLVLSGHANFRFPGVPAETLLARLDLEGVAASAGAACSAGAAEPSHVLRACGFNESEAREGVRFSFGRGNTVEEAKMAAGIVLDTARAIRSHR